MKVVHISIIDPFADGWNYQHNMLIKYHRRLGHEVSIIVPTRAWTSRGVVENVPAGTTINPDGVKIIRLATKPGAPISRLARYEGFLSTVESEKPDVIFVHGCQFLDVCLLAKYAKKHPGLRFYVDNHADLFNSASSMLSRQILHKCIWRFCARRIAPYVRKFYGVLPARVDFLREFYHTPAEKTELLVMGVDDELANAAAAPEVNAKIRAQYGIGSDDFLIVSGGKIDMLKRHILTLMEAVHRNPDQKVKLLVFGSVIPELKEQLEKLCDGSRVQYIGWVQGDETYQYFAAADLLVFPCLHSVFWEQATGQGKPILVKKIQGFQHVDLGGNVAYIEKDDLETIQSALSRITGNPEVYSRMKAVAEEKGRETFSYLNIAKRSIER